MITDRKLVELGFRCYQVNTLMYFEKGDVKLEKKVELLMNEL